jgi:hypothetical protein
VGTGMNAPVRSLAVYKGELYVGGDFTIAGGIAANYIAKWDGTSWSALGSGTNATVLSLGVYNGDLYAGGSFTVAGGSNADHIAKWNNPIGIEERNINVKIKAYLSLTSTILNISKDLNEFQNSEIEIVNYLGQTIIKMPYISTIDVSELASGIYMIKIKTNSKIYYSRFVKASN